MCGITGFLLTPRGIDDPEGVLRRMTDTLTHRGPDDSGVLFDPHRGVGLGHTRLAIIDLSHEGRQPMCSRDGRYAITYNGEIYNFEELRVELVSRGASFRGRSDTEVLIELIAADGLERALSKCVGMFAFALWDRRDGTLCLVRDRAGEKPLYYGRVGNEFVFASELGAFSRFPGFEGRIDREALALYTRHSCVPAPFSIFERIKKVRPAEIVRVAVDRADFPVRSTTYWDATEIVSRASRRRFDGTDQAAESEFETTFGRAVRQQMIADVPLGAFLSGGIDSTAVVASMQSQASKPVATFTIGFHERSFDEAAYAREIARYLGTEHTELYVDPATVVASIPTVSDVYDEPFGDSSQVPTILVSRMARRAVTVALSGDGADEVFGGYTRHVWATRMWRVLSRVPMSVRARLARLLHRVPAERIDSVYERLGRAVPRLARVSLPGDKFAKLTGILTSSSLEDLYRRLVTLWPAGSGLLIADGDDTQTPRESAVGMLDPIEWMMLLDYLTYLADDILVKVDRASMAMGLEVRAPFLDHRLFELAATLPPRMKVRGGRGKWLLRRALAKRVPMALWDRPKSGFAMPIDSWLRGPLCEWAMGFLSETSLRDGGFFDPTVVAARWREHVSGERQWQHHLWNVLMFQSWLASWRSRFLSPSVDQPSNQSPVPADGVAHLSE